MISDQDLFAQLPFVLTGTDYPFLGDCYHGKVRDNYVRGKSRILITTDRLSCFDRVVTTVPFKGQVLNELAQFWFDRTRHIVPNHVQLVPDPNVLVGVEAEVLPVEVVVRQFIAGSAWRDYAEGKLVSGVKLPLGIRPHERLPQPIITPSTKAAAGSHDEPISETEILKRGLVPEVLWRQICDVSLKLFAAGSEEVAKRGLLLVDTKYEFGLVDGVLTLVDELHTLDCSRYWKEDTYIERYERGEVPEMLDKQPTRQWLLEQGFKGDGEIPMFSDEHRVSIARHYISSFELISGKVFSGTVGPVADRIEKSLRDLISRE